MEFRTELSTSDKQLTIGYSDKIMLMGSCFSDSIGKILTTSQFQTLINPFRTVFNPLIICKLLIKAIDQVSYTPDGLLRNNDLFFHYDLHSSFSNKKSEKFIKKVNKQLQKTRVFLMNADFLILTFGSSIGYYLKSNDQIVGNCHKVPASEFTKKMISQEEFNVAFTELFTKLVSLNPSIKVILTVSPVRHTKEGLVNSSLSKAKLLSMSNSLVSKYDWLSYFPSFEIMMDDLRDYRFYKKDMIHPNEVAVEYIFQKFIDWSFSEQTRTQLQNIRKVSASIQHKSQQPTSEQHKTFMSKLVLDIEKLQLELGRPIFKKAKNKLNKRLR